MAAACALKTWLEETIMPAVFVITAARRKKLAVANLSSPAPGPSMIWTLPSTFTPFQ
jgi:hypothetical protein